MSPTCGTCANFQLGLWISASSVGNIKIVKSLIKSRKQFASRLISSQTEDPDSCLVYTSILNTFIFLTTLFAGQSQDIANQIINTMKQDMEAWEKSGQWIFSCYRYECRIPGIMSTRSTASIGVILPIFKE